jgi:cyclopropane fatty-acyl-phospholipid synthase-like methyltransferase
MEAEMREAMKKLKNSYKGDAFGFEKYFKYDYCIDKKKRVYKWLDIPENSAILDISSGFGYFPYVCQKEGHTVTLTDVLGWMDEVCIQAREVLGLPKAIEFMYTDKTYNDLPEDIGKFDLITAFAVSPMSFFSQDNWRAYIKDCKRHLNKGGMIYVEPNASPGRDNLFNLKDEYDMTGNKKGVKICYQH